REHLRSDPNLNVNMSNYPPHVNLRPSSDEFQYVISDSIIV
ncbi:7884_t:CDS:1, partial [Funneliformis caledonium]